MICKHRSYELENQVVVITGASGLLGWEHVWACHDAGAEAIVGVDIAVPDGSRDWPDNCKFIIADVTKPATGSAVLDHCVRRHGGVDCLINNAANNPKVEDGPMDFRFETFPLEQWEGDLAVGLTGAFLMMRALGTLMANSGGGSILNIASVLSVIAPDQRLYDGGTKPVSYSVEKAGLVGLTRYVATYWAHRGVTCNALSPAGVYTSQPEDFVARLSDKIPVGRMARRMEYRKAVVFALSQPYMTGHNLVIDGGYSVW